MALQLHRRLHLHVVLEEAAAKRGLVVGLPRRGLDGRLHRLPRRGLDGRLQNQEQSMPTARQSLVLPPDAPEEAIARSIAKMQLKCFDSCIYNTH
jgi:hypothetical protein